jgi:type I restriction-modification system DNA methylase subunit
MSGRAKSPVQQAWDYALDLVGSKWVLISNLIELRLYAFGHGRSSYERFDIASLDDPDELKRLWLLTGADNLLTGRTAALLEQSQNADKEITNRLYADYKSLRDRLIDTLDSDHPTLGRLAAIEHSQTILDRVLFMAFAEDNDLIPLNTIRKALGQKNDFVEFSLWDVFKGLFRAIDKGKTRKRNGIEETIIYAYNGGLFAPNPELDALNVPDDLCQEFERLAEYDFERDVSVAVMGHVFEQSITDIKAMQAAARGEELPVATKRKREGVVYTPPFVTSFIAEQTIGRTLEERFLTLLPRYAKVKARHVPGEDITWRSGKAEREFWEAYREELRRLTVVDPACGSGAFLIAAFDFLSAEYRRVNDRLAEIGRRGSDATFKTGTLGLFDPDAEILAHNLYGVDVNSASVEITKLSLWIKTAKRGKALDSLEANIRVGNSLIEDTDYHPRAFVWRDAFPHIFQEGGFDIVLGNPPYVRMELIKPIKPYLETRFEVVADRADLYAYFFEQGARLLKLGTGRLGYISSATFFRSGSGQALRRYLSSKAAIEVVIDFGTLQLFEGVTTYPAILTLRRLGEQESISGDLQFLSLSAHLPNELATVFRAEAKAMPRMRLSETVWSFEEAGPAILRTKLRSSARTLSDVYGPPLYGIKTGLNDAFVIDRVTRDRLVDANSSAKDLLKPFLKGENVRRWRVQDDELFLINIPKGKIDINRYPSVRDHLLPFHAALDSRATKQSWFELQQAQLAYQPKMLGPKVVWPHFQARASFCLDREGYFINNKAFFIPNLPLFELAFLNSRLGWFILSSLARIKRGGFIEAEAQYVGQLPSVSDFPNPELNELSDLATRAGQMARDRDALISSVRRRIPDLGPAGRSAKVSGKLNDWWALDFATFRNEVKKNFKQDVPLAERNAWEAYLKAEGDKIKRLSREIEHVEREIDCIVYKLFDLSPEEIVIVEGTFGQVPGQQAA